MDVLRWLRSRRVTRREAAHLLDVPRLTDRSPAGDANPGLADLLAAAAAPARPAELAGERAAVAAFRREYRPADPDASPGPAAAPRQSRARRRVAIATLSAAAALVGGTAYAAGAGRLPDPVQRQLHEALAGVGVPPPPTRGTPTPTPGSTSAPAPASGSPADVRLLELCRAWQATRADPGALRLRPDEQRVLADAAGGQNRIEVFCVALAGTPAPGTATPGAPAPGNTAPGKPGKPGNPNPGGPPVTPPGQGKGRASGPSR